MLGHRASSQIVWRLAPWISFLTSKYFESCDGARTFIHSGRRGRSATGKESSTEISLMTQVLGTAPVREAGAGTLDHERRHRRVLRPETMRNVRRPEGPLALVVNAASSSPQAVIQSVNGAGSRSTLSA